MYILICKNNVYECMMDLTHDRALIKPHQAYEYERDLSKEGSNVPKDPHEHII